MRRVALAWLAAPGPLLVRLSGLRPAFYASGRRAHHRCSVPGCPWRLDCSRADALLTAWRGRATSMSFLRARTRDAALTSIPAGESGAGVGFPQPLEVAWAGFLVEGGGGWRAPTCSPPVVRGCPWACRQQGWAGGPKKPPARGGGAGPRTVVSRCRWPSGRSSDCTSSLGKSVRALPRSAAFPVGVDSPCDARGAPWTDRALAYCRR